ncbi:MAG: hypothetical protein E6Q97_05175 [Desulfurellales bacterium]|nr:MAG: hypothetical protein E6Q97_05175 [Desulfurellales bacterium]
MTKKTTFMVAAGASVVVVRDGKRKTISAGSGTDFSEEEIASINRASPGALRKPINERAVRAAVEADIEDDEDADEAEAETKAAATKTAAKKASAKKAAPAKDDAEDADEEDADEDEDI